MHKKCPGFFEQKSLKTGKFGYQMQKKSPVPKNRRNFGYWRKKSWILPKRAGPRWNFNVGRPGRNTGNAPILAAADRRVSGLLIVGQLQQASTIPVSWTFPKFTLMPESPVTKITAVRAWFRFLP